MARPFRRLVDDGILDSAAALFAQRGFAKTSLQDVAAAVGLSKAGLLHHFPSKESLHEAVLEQAGSLGEQVVDEVRDLPLGPARDRRAVEVLVDVALAHPGLVALLLSPATRGGSPQGAADPGADPADDIDPTVPADAAFAAFGVDRATAAPERLVRVLGVLSSVAVLTLAAHAEGRTTAWRPHVVATCLDALGTQPRDHAGDPLRIPLPRPDSREA